MLWGNFPKDLEEGSRQKPLETDSRLPLPGQHFLADSFSTSSGQVGQLEMSSQITEFPRIMQYPWELAA